MIVWLLFLIGGALGVDPIRGTLWLMACMLTICAVRLGRLQAPGATIAPNTPQSVPQGRSSIVGRPRGICGGTAANPLGEARPWGP